MFGPIHNLGELATAAASLITVSSLFVLLFKGAQYLLSAPARLRAYFFRPKYIIIPTPVELAQYCVKSFDGRKPSEEEAVEERWHQIVRRYKRQRKITASRIVIMSSSFVLAAIIFIGRMIYFGFLPSFDLKGAVGLSTWITLFASTSLYLAYAFVRDPLRRKNTMQAVGRWITKM